MNFFNAYEQYIKDTEPPRNFHVWTGIGTISALLGRKCYIPQGHFTVYPNLYVVLTGPAGVKKSSAMKVGKDILKSQPNFPLAPSSITREALLMTLEENAVEYSLKGRNYSYHQATAFANEMQEFIGGKHINQAMVGIMTSIWDEHEFEYKTANKASVVIPSPYFTLVGCCTDEWISTKLKGDIITDGFARRVVFVLEKERACYNAWPESTPAKEDAFETLVHEAKRIRKIKGKFRFTDAARKRWEELYHEIQAEVDSKDAYVQNYYGSKHTLMQKVCMCLSAAKDNSMIVDREMLDLVHQIFLSTEENLLEVFAGLGRNELSTYQEMIYSYVCEQDKPVPVPELVNKFTRDLRVDEYEEVTTVLQSRGLIKLDIHGYVPVKKKAASKRQDLFALMKAYDGKARESVSDSAEVELSRLVDYKTLHQQQSSSDRVDLLKRGILATSDQLQGI